ncbi:MAG TPA: tricarballylate utilization 4Fe-4S protein TcuB [Vicinamibacterales bacterium]|nr:tricarballylate utilization 4Fe-4S protein TcuB [Vicinamibacterales bacterium]
MPRADLADLVERGTHVMTVCNACRYCEQYCPVFPAMERRTSFVTADLAYLANLCHNCGECLYACQYAPPHEFGINVPLTLAEIRVRSYEEYCWPRALGASFHRQGVRTALLLAGALALMVLLLSLGSSRMTIWPTDRSADFYAVIPHDVLVAVFGGVFVFSLVVIGMGLTRFWRAMNNEDTLRTAPSAAPVPRAPGWAGAIRDALILRHLRPGSVDCVSGEENRTPWRRWFHHVTLYGFLFCFASTTVAAIYHTVFGWLAPYSYSSVPVILGTLGGGGLIVGPAGLFLLRRERDPALGGGVQKGLDESFLALLFLTAVTGLALLFFRDQPVMGILLVIHLGLVLALFVTLPYGKFVHGLYRLVALLIDAREKAPPST